MFTGLNLGAFSTTPVVPLSQNVPGFAPPGQYYLHGVIGQYGWPITSIDAFGFQKMVVAQNDGAPVDNWAATGLDQTTMSEEVEQIVLPTDYSLGDPYPNPFNPSTNISVTLPETATLSMIVYDLNGREVATLADGEFSAGVHGFTVDGHGLASGVYFLRADSPGHLSETRRLVLMK
ncbi:hypothetical protein BMS3Bbin04_01721 [bacterium BMS3Bbin04]|nr:hypothetical protein BMS3Bbin04_01721 [bacterium BMS3Bbin04]